MATDESFAPRQPRSPPFPFIALGKAVERAKQLYPKALRHQVGFGVLADAWSYGQKSSGLVQTVSALIQFGFLADEGSGERRKFQLTKEAIRIVQDDDPNSEKRKELLKRAALAPKLHRELWGRFTTATMSELVIRNYLMFDRVEANEAPFGSEAATALINEYKSTLSFANIDKDGIPSSLLDTQGEETETKSVEHSLGQGHSPAGAAIQRPRVSRTERKPGMKEDVFSLKEGDVVLQYPEQLSATSYEDLEAWAQIILRKIKRSVSNSQVNDEGHEPSN